MGKFIPIILGGRVKSVVVCDCDGFWDLERLQHLIHTYILSRVKFTLSEDVGNTLPDDIEAQISPSIPILCQEALGRLHLFRPPSSLSFLATLISLPKYHSENMPDQELSVLMIDSISAFAWPQPGYAEPISDSGFGFPGLNPRSQLPDDVPMQLVLDSIDRLRRGSNLVTFITTWTPLFPVPNRSRRDEEATQVGSTTFTYPRQQLLPPYPTPFNEVDPLSLKQATASRQTSSYITHHITLQPQNTLIKNLTKDDSLPRGQRTTAYVRTPVRLERDLEELRARESNLVEGATHQRSNPPFGKSSLRGQVLEGRFEFSITSKGLSFAPPAEEGDSQELGGIEIF